MYALSVANASRAARGLTDPSRRISRPIVLSQVSVRATTSAVVKTGDVSTHHSARQLYARPICSPGRPVGLPDLGRKQSLGSNEIESEGGLQRLQSCTCLQGESQLRLRSGRRGVLRMRHVAAEVAPPSVGGGLPGGSSVDLTRGRRAVAVTGYEHRGVGYSTGDCKWRDRSKRFPGLLFGRDETVPVGLADASHRPDVVGAA